MGQLLYGSARTTEVVRRAIQHSEESPKALIKRYDVNPKTVAEWKKRASCADLPTGRKDPRSTSLWIEEEAVVVAFPRHMLLPLSCWCGSRHWASADKSPPPIELPASRTYKLHHQGGDATIARRTTTCGSASPTSPPPPISLVG